MLQFGFIPDNQLTRDDIARISAAVWQYTYRIAGEDDAMATVLWEQAAEMLADGHPGALAWMNMPESLASLVSAARWEDQGRPVVQMGHKYAAALMATSVPKDIGPYVAPPWHAFLIELPDGLLSTYFKGELADIAWIMVQRFQPKPGPRWHVIGYTRTSKQLTRYNMPIEDLLDDRLTDDSNDGPFNLPFDDRDERVLNLMCRLAVNVCLAMSAPEAKEGGRTTRSKPKGSGALGKDAPTYRIYQIGQSLDVDCREAVRDYVEHGSSSGGAPKVRTLVRGHWKPRLGARLGHPVWIEPYWRGPDGAPIIARPHVLSKEGAA